MTVTRGSTGSKMDALGQSRSPTRKKDVPTGTTLRFKDIRTIDGYTFVGRRVHFNDDIQVTKVLYTHDFELNPELGPQAFSNGWWRPRGYEISRVA